MPNLIWHKQKQATSCVSACVQMVLTNFGEDWSESDVRHLLGNPKLGITLKQAEECLKNVNIGILWVTDWSLDELRDSLRQGDYPIVGVERHILGHAPASHAVIITHISSNQVGFLDPLDGPEEKFSGREAFDRAWRLSGKEALRIKGPI